MKALGNRIKHLRVKSGLSKAALARRVGVSDVTISYWESGTIKQIGHERLIALAQALDCPLKDLLDKASAAHLLPAPAPLHPNNSRFLLHLRTRKPLPWLEEGADKPDGSSEIKLDAASAKRNTETGSPRPKVENLLSECYFVTPGEEEHFDFLGEGDIAAIAPVTGFQQNGLYLIERLGQLEIKHIERLASGRMKIQGEDVQAFVIEIERELSIQLLGRIKARWNLLGEISP
ncbi:hypothetical protein GCM10027040_22320 [Halomonas shantousis]